MGVVIQGPWKAQRESRKLVDIRQLIDHELAIVERLAEQSQASERYVRPHLVGEK